MRIFFGIVLPVIWVAAALTSYFHPGDEYGIFLVSSVAGSWVCFLIPDVGRLRDVLWLILLIGAAVLGFLGFLMDRLRLSRRMWGVMFGLCFLVIFVLGLMQFPSLDRAIRKNGSITAYVAGAWNIGLYFSVILSFVGRAITGSGR
jgi:glucan phosphoethanolaminetransferase (alkaline phosphatase superfamily)